MRVKVTSSKTLSPNRSLLATRLIHCTNKTNIKVQVIDPSVTIFVSDKQALLETDLDVAGNPSQGLGLTANNGVVDFLGFVGELWAICSVTTDIEVLSWPVTAFNQPLVSN